MLDNFVEDAKRTVLKNRQKIKKKEMCGNLNKEKIIFKKEHRKRKKAKHDNLIDNQNERLRKYKKGKETDVC